MDRSELSAGSLRGLVPLVVGALAAVVLLAVVADREVASGALAGGPARPTVDGPHARPADRTTTTTSTTVPPTTTTTAPPAPKPVVAASSGAARATSPTPPPPAPPPAPAPPPGPALSSSSSAEAEVLSFINARRSEHGLAPVRRNGCLDGISRSWSFEMARRQDLAHNPSAASQAGSCVAWTSAGENVGYASSAARVNQLWWASGSHHDAILGPYTQVGIGAVWDGSKMWVTVDFVG